MTSRERKKLPILPPFRRVALYLLITALFLVADNRWAGAMLENHFLYFPDKDLTMTPTNVRLPFEEVTFPAADGTLLHGWFVPGDKQKPVVLFFHGNAGNISHRVDNILRLNRLGLSVFIFDYRGYGRSAGEPSEPGLYNDARGALDWLNSRADIADQHIYFGRSLGAAVALQLALDEPPTALIMESPFTSVGAMGKEHYPLLYRLLGWLLEAEYDNEEKIRGLQVPLLVIHGTRDTIVPAAMGRKLFSAAPEPKQLFLIEGADHNDAFYPDEPGYWAAWRNFLEPLGLAASEVQ
jgi:fermentation-respiration switch protein FrsA (DUF1100 family)